MREFEKTESTEQFACLSRDVEKYRDGSQSTSTVADVVNFASTALSVCRSEGQP